MRASLLLFALLFLNLTLIAQVPQTPKRPLLPSDIYRLQTPHSLEVSPDGNWILYTVRKADSAKDKFSSSLWMISWDGKENVQLTFDKSASSAKWSPDGKYISFVGTRDDEKNSQVYVLDRRGGEARKITNVKGDIDEYNWSPGGDRLVLSIKDEDYSDTAGTKVRKPYVIDRYHFKQDRQGYLDSAASHLYLLTVATKKLDTLTRGFYSEEQPFFSPDGKHIAFVSNRSALPDNNANSDLFVMEARTGASPRKLTSWEGSDEQPAWSPDGKMIAYLQSSSNEPFTMYGQPLVTIIPANGGDKKILTAAADRPIRNIRWSKDGSQLTGLMEDDREVVLVSIDPTTGKLIRLTNGERSFYEMEWNRHKNAAITVMSTPYVPAELFALEGSGLRQLTHLQDSFLAPLQLPKVEGFRSKSKDGTSVSGILYRPANVPTGSKLPLIIFIHGGPVAQDEFDFDLDRMIYASAGYAVAAVNYRGSSGRGLSHIRSIYGDWGNKEVMDIVGAADHLVSQGIADPARMGLGGWSYGGITTNYTVATDQRFKAAVSGAGSSLQLSLYGSDQYVTQYERELGYPWKNPEKWIAVSYPFFKADRIKTPTLFMASENDFNVPVTGAEQMYQALKSLNIPTGLIIYPKQYHGISVPSYLKDRYQRHIAWYNKYLN